MDFQNLSKTGNTLIAIALKAGAEIMRHYDSPGEVETKQDQSPVTKADKAAEAIILPELEKNFPDIPVISEEAASMGHLPEVGREFFLVDPLDGTREFIKKNGEFTVNIALVKDGEPRAGIVYAPAIEKAYYGEQGFGAWQILLGDVAAGSIDRIEPISAKPMADKNLILVGSRSHGDPQQAEFVKSHNIGEQKLVGSSLKFCMIAEGKADIYPRFGRTMEWDTAAGQAVLESAGGTVVVMDKDIPPGEKDIPLGYGKRQRGYDNPPFIAKGAP